MKNGDFTGGAWDWHTYDERGFSYVFSKTSIWVITIAIILICKYECIWPGFSNFRHFKTRQVLSYIMKQFAFTFIYLAISSY